jgi:glucose dehydrogenase
VSGAVWKNVFVTSGLFGDVYGFDVRSGVQLWRFHSVAQQGEFGGDSWHKQQQGANGWGGLSVDEVRGIAFVSLGAPRPDMVGVGRLGDNLFSNCVVALDALTGKRLWHFQDVRHDLWDLDVCAPPNLLTIQREGRSFDVVTGMSKAGHLMLLDRLSGKPVFPWRLRRAPVTKLVGERTADYQPDPELPEPISRLRRGRLLKRLWNGPTTDFLRRLRRASPRCTQARVEAPNGLGPRLIFRQGGCMSPRIVGFRRSPSFPTARGRGIRASRRRAGSRIT